MERIPGKEGSRETSKHTKHHGRGHGDAAESPERGASHPLSAAIPGRRRLGYSAPLQASGLMTGHLFSSVLTFIGLGSSWQVSSEMGEEILLWLE